MSGESTKFRRRLLSESAIDKEYFKRNIEQQPVEDISMNVFYESRSLTVLVLIIILLTYFAFTRYFFIFPYIFLLGQLIFH